MPKYGRKQIFTHRSFPEVGEKQKEEEEKRKEEKNTPGTRGWYRRVNAGHAEKAS